MNVNIIKNMFKGFAFFQQLSEVLDETKSPNEYLAMVNNVILTRCDFWSLGLRRDIDGMVSIENVLC